MTIDLSAIPEALADALTISEFAAELMLSVFVIMIIVCVAAIFTRNFLVLIFFGFLGMIINIALGWLDYWVLLICALGIAFGYAALMTKIMQGG